MLYLAISEMFRVKTTNIKDHHVACPQDEQPICSRLLSKRIKIGWIGLNFRDLLIFGIRKLAHTKFHVNFLLFKIYR